jgi:hypothetical protein
LVGVRANHPAANDSEPTTRLRPEKRSLIETITTQAEITATHLGLTIFFLYGLAKAIQQIG